MQPDFSISEINGVTATYPSIYGDIKSCWKRSNDRITWRVNSPANTTATIFLPDGTRKEIGSGNHVIEVADPKP